MTQPIALDPSIEEIARAVMYEGYQLYPYRASAQKNQQRWIFGTIYPKDYTQATGNHDRHALGTQVLLEGPAENCLRVQVRCLVPACKSTRDMERLFETEFDLKSDISDAMFDCDISSELSLCARVLLGVELLDADLRRLTIRVENLSPMPIANSRSDAEQRLLASVHLLLQADRRAFVSAIDPPSQFAQHAAACHPDGLWPVLIGDQDSRSTMLAAPMILEDYPRIAPESPGNLFDGTEIDELLSLRILTLTEEEKRIAANENLAVAAMLQRVESMSQSQLLSLHGAWRTNEPNTAAKRSWKIGDAVRIAPQSRADAMDLLLAGRCGTVAGVEVDFEGRTHIAVTLDDDPGRDLGEAGKIGHRFFYRPEELEPL